MQPLRRPARRQATIAAALLLVVVAALVAVQIILPQVAARRIVKNVSGYADDVQVEVKAFPAWKLLTDHHADRVKIEIGHLRTGQGDFDRLLTRLEGADRIDVHVGSVTDLGIGLHDLELHNEGRRLEGRMQIDRAELERLLGPIEVDRVALARRRLAFRAEIPVFGEKVPVSVSVVAKDGRIVLAGPGGFVIPKFVIYENPRLHIDDVRASAKGSRFIFTTDATLAGR